MPPAAIYAQALRYKADLAARESVAMSSMANRWLLVMRGLEGEIDAVARTMALRRAQGLPVGAGYLYRTERYQELLRQAYGQFIRYEDFAVDLIARNTATFARLGREYGLGLLDVLEPGVSGSFNRLSVGAIETMAGFVETGPLRALLADAWPHAIEQTTSALVKGVALGYGPRKIAKMMNEGMSTGLNRSMVIARTESLRAYRATKMETWRETGLVRGFQRVSTHDRRVCPACLFSEGEFIPVQGDFAEHPQGRCSLVPVLRNGDLHKWQYGAEWFEQQPAATQVSILGPGRHAAWKAGKFGLRDVPVVQPNATWGPSMRARGLAELTGQGRIAARVVVPVTGTPVFTTVKEAEAWARENLVFGSSVRYDGLAVETVNAINKHLAERLPDVAHLSKFEDGKLRSIITQQTRGDWHMAMNQDTAILSINTKYDTLEKWADMRDRDIPYQARNGVPFSSKWYFPREKAIDITLDHEIGHSVQWSLNAEQKKAWAKATREAGRSGWRRPTDYAAHDKQEEFAEYFALYVNGRRDLMTPDMAALFDDVLRKP